MTSTNYLGDRTRWQTSVGVKTGNTITVSSPVRGLAGLDLSGLGPKLTWKERVGDKVGTYPFSLQKERLSRSIYKLQTNFTEVRRPGLYVQTRGVLRQGVRRRE